LAAIVGVFLNGFVTLLLGVMLIPIVAFVAGPLFGCSVVALMIGGYYLAKHFVSEGTWRSEYAWSLISPLTGFFFRKRLRREEPHAARLVTRLMIASGICLYALSWVAGTAVRRDGAARLERSLANPATARVIIEKYGGGWSSERLHSRDAYKKQTPERRSEIDAALRAAQKAYYTDLIQRRANGKTLEETRRALRHDRLPPSRQAALDAAWKSLQTRPGDAGIVTNDPHTK
jgi:hypothetical protein